MWFEDFFDTKTIIKFLVLFIPLEIYIFTFAPSFKWLILLTIGAVIGLLTALGGSSLRRRT